ncbi:helix-turn-helix transcriptional regulator [Actinomadura montaniterrae]|uniref:Helix-turn-helix transcriptional regulator n=1 Tax=Actinomadura montaniterrae TaxID=1803903 RepID=A0A6L3W0W1_9ACTN|nr:helix-turn-helix transcriptional regulator [Actinomadura montaniterrae]KAB2384875.1 helix-turn-helix transcriptional regulator [Actinomadura montaniterrae]
MAARSAETAVLAPSAANDRRVMPGPYGGMAAGSYAFEGDLRDLPADMPWHSHDLHQLEYAFEGVVLVETAVARYRLPPRQAVWIPAGLAHKSTFAQARTVSVFFEPSLVPDRAGRARVLPVEPVLREMMIYALRWRIGRTSSDPVADSYFETLAHLVSDGLRYELPFFLPTSTDPLVAAVMRHTDDHLDTVDLRQVCETVRVSERTLRRRFHASTGMTWRQYTLHSRILHAMTLLVDQEATIMSVATAVGFDSASAFSRAFQSYTGRTPTAFRQKRGASEVA